MHKTLGVAIVGCGAISKMHLDAIKQMPMARLLYVCDINIERAKQAAYVFQCEYTNDYLSLLSKPEIDIVHILTPHHLHRAMAISAIDAGKHVILEKPIGITFEELQLLMNKAEENQLHIAVIFQNRYNPTSLYLKEVVDSGQYGALLATKAILTWHRDRDYYESSSWRGRWSTEGGGLLMNQAIHTIDLLQWLGGQVTSVKGHIDNHCHPFIEVEDTALATLYYANGTIGSFYATNNYAINSSIEIEFLFEQATFTQRDEALIRKTLDDKVEAVAVNNLSNGEKSYWGAGHKICIEDAYKHILNNEKPPISIKEALIANEIILGIYESSKNNQKYRMKVCK
jgi:predicted dehydrogenase